MKLLVVSTIVLFCFSIQAQDAYKPVVVSQWCWAKEDARELAAASVAQWKRAWVTKAIAGKCTSGAVVRGFAVARIGSPVYDGAHYLQVWEIRLLPDGSGREPMTIYTWSKAEGPGA